MHHHVGKRWGQVSQEPSRFCGASFVSPPAAPRAESRSYPSAEGNRGAGERGPPSTGTAAKPQSCPGTSGVGGTVLWGRGCSCLCPARALPVLPVLPALPVPCPCPSRSICLHPLTCGAARLRHSLRLLLPLQLLREATAAADPAGKERLPPREKDSAWPRPSRPGPRGTAGEEKKGKGIEGRGRKEREGTARCFFYTRIK